MAGTTGTHCYTWLIPVLSVEMRFHHVTQTVLKFLRSSDPPPLACQTAGTIGMSHSTWPLIFIEDHKDEATNETKGIFCKEAEKIMFWMPSQKYYLESG